MIHVEFANEKRVWKVKDRLVKYSWYLVIAQWSEDKGLQLVLDGQLENQKVDKNGKSVVSQNTP